MASTQKDLERETISNMANAAAMGQRILRLRKKKKLVGGAAYFGVYECVGRAHAILDWNESRLPVESGRRKVQVLMRRHGITGGPFRLSRETGGIADSQY